ncbi:MAG: DUF2905 domain-containing protein [Desulfarculus sp.]|nr:MAG: DUF2905 domain-containing protein [Desulfarculus sp.]
MLPYLGKLLFILGLALVGVGALLWLAPKVSWLGWLGHLPGDINLKGERFSFYFPLATSLVISGVLTLLFWLFRR